LLSKEPNGVFHPHCKHGSSERGTRRARTNAHHNTHTPHARNLAITATHGRRCRQDVGRSRPEISRSISHERTDNLRDVDTDIHECVARAYSRTCHPPSVDCRLQRNMYTEFHSDQHRVPSLSSWFEVLFASSSEVTGRRAEEEKKRAFVHLDHAVLHRHTQSESVRPIVH
jgi:hypothetical protein